MELKFHFTKNFRSLKTGLTSVFLLLLAYCPTTLHAQDGILTAVEAKYESRITSATTDEQIAAIVGLLNEKHKLDLKFKKIFRNDNNEITGLKIVLSDENGVKENYNLSEGDPIDPIRIFVKTDGNTVTSFGIMDGISDKPADEDEEEQKNKKPAAGLQGSAVAKNDGVAREKAFQAARLLAADDIDAVKQNEDVDYKMAYISLNGKEISLAQMEKIDPNSVSRVSTISKSSGVELMGKYGEKAQYGVIIIETKISSRELTSADIAALPDDFTLDSEEGAFIIHKKTQLSDLAFYKKQLATIGVTLDYTDFERDSAGFLTSIKLKLKDEVANVAFSNWMTFASAGGIINVFVGKKKGRINISTR